MSKKPKLLSKTDIEAQCEVLAKLLARIATAQSQKDLLAQAATKKPQKVLDSLMPEAIALQTKLLEAIAGSEHLFDEPKSMRISGLHLGLRAGQPSIATKLNANELVELIKARFNPPDFLLIKTPDKADEKSLLKLEASALKKLQCEMVPAANAPFLTAEKSAGFTLVKAA